MSCCMRTFRTSAGFPAIPPRKPEVEAIAMRTGKEGEEDEGGSVDLRCS